MDQMKNDERGSSPVGGLRYRVPGKDIATSVLGLGPIPLSQVIKTNTSVAEANRLEFDSSGLTPAEEVARASAVTRAKKHLEKVCVGEAKRLIAEIKGVLGRVNFLNDTITQLRADSVVGPNGEKLSTDEAVDHHDVLRDQIVRETQEGSTKHLIRRSRSKTRELLLLVLDYPVFLMAMFSLFNVNIRHVFVDLSSVVVAMTAVVFAIMGTVLYAYVMRVFGRRHRLYKDDDGTLNGDRAGLARIRAERWIAIIITVAAAAVMAMRIWDEGVQADAPMVLIVSLAALFSALLGVSGYINYMSEYEDGSDTTDRVQHLSVVLLSREANIGNQARQRTVLIEEAGIKIAALNRLLTHAREHALQMVVTSKADRGITLSRSYRAVPVPLPEPDLSSPTIDLTLRQAEELATHHEFLKLDLQEGK